MAARTSETNQADAKRRTPAMATQASGAAHPFMEASPPFYWTFHPERWTIIAGKLVPALQKFPLVDGVNNVSVRKDGSISFATARAKLEEEGRTLIPWTWAPDGVSYLQCVDTRPRGGKEVAEAWISVFESADIGGAETTSDEEAYAEWLGELVSGGKLPACTPNVASRMADKANERLGQAEAEAAKLGGKGRAAIRAKALAIEAEVLAACVKVNKTSRTAAKAKGKDKGPLVVG